MRDCNCNLISLARRQSARPSARPSARWIASAAIIKIGLPADVADD
jgi:hypothetical protein